jgi:hypothetical protein
VEASLGECEEKSDKSAWAGIMSDMNLVEKAFPTDKKT